MSEQTPDGRSVGQAVPDPRTGALRALAHPLRLRILSLLTGAELSASEVARELGITQANASYHLRVLLRAGEVVEAGETTIRGGVAKRYRHPWQRVEQQPRAGEDHELMLRTMAEELVRRHRLRRPGRRGLTTDAELWVDPEVRDEVLDLVTRAARLVHDRARPPRTPGTVPVNLTAAFFEMTDDASAHHGTAADPPVPETR